MTFIINSYQEQVQLVMNILTRDSDVSDEELKDFIIKKAEDTLKATPCELFNNYTNRRSKTDMVKLLDWYDNKNPIPCEHGTFFKRHDQAQNLNAAFVKSFLDTRKAYKKLKFQAEEEENDDLVAYYHRLQLTYKIFANSYYGVQGMRSSVFYNLFAALSITGRGQTIISSAATTFERFLSNNIKFANMDDCLLFIGRVVNEEREFNDEDVLDTDITKGQLMKYLATLFENMSDCIENQDVLKDVIIRLTQEEVNRCYYKNNLYAFLINEVPLKLIEGCITDCQEFMNPVVIPGEIKTHMDLLWAYLKEYVYYDTPVYDRITWINNQVRKSVITIDTDSNFLNLEPFYEFVVENVSFDIDESDDNATYKIVNIISNILGLVIAEAYETLTKYSNVPQDKRHFINMKNEFLMSRVLLTSNKKNYASNVLLQEGVVIPDRKSLDIKGLAIKKADLNRNIGAALQVILKEDILKSKTIDTRLILEKLSDIENSIQLAFKEGSVEFMKPAKCNEIESYKNPFTQAPVRATLAYNAVFTDTPITYPAQINMCKVLASKLEDISYMYEHFPEVYTALKEKIYDDEDLGKYGITYFALPKTMDSIPLWLIPIIDIDTIAVDSLKSFFKILASIGLKTINVDCKTEYLGNIIDF